MQIDADASAFWTVVSDVRAQIGKLNGDSSLDGLAARFEGLLNDLPSDFFVCEPMAAVLAGSVDPAVSTLRVVVRPGPRLYAFAAALGALDLNASVHVGT